MALPASLGLALLLAPPAEATSEATSDTVELRWSGPTGCPSATQVRARVQTDAGALAVAADAVVTHDETGWSLDLRIEGNAGVDARTLRGESCEALADAAALLIGVAAAPKPAEAEFPEPELEPEPAPDPGPDPSVQPHEPEPEATHPAPFAPSPADVSPSRTPLPIALHSRVSGVLQLGQLLPGVVTGGIAAAMGFTAPWVRVEARGSYLGPREVRDPGATDIGARIDGWSAGASGCVLWESDTDRVFVPLCVGAQLGRARARGFGLDQSGVGRGLWAHAIIDAGLGVRVAPRWALVGSAEAVVSLRRPAFRVRDSPTLFQTGAAGARVLLGVEFRFLSFSRDRKPRTRRLAKESP